MITRSILPLLAVLSSAVLMACGGSNAGAPGPGASPRALEADDDGSAAGTTDGEGCAYTLQYDPVCGTDGKTYTNSAHAACEGVEVAHTGECTDDGCVYTLEYDPVCGTDGKTYTNSGHAACEGVEVAHEGACNE